jgi:uncharacterized membrane protein (UPF0127 family)
MIKNLTKGIVLAEKVNFARSFKSRLIGLIGKRHLEGRSSLILSNCNAVHTFFMQFAIDALFLDGQGKVVGKIEAMPPFRVSPLFFKAKTCIELPAGTLRNSSTQVSDIISIEPQ